MSVKHKYKSQFSFKKQKFISSKDSPYVVNKLYGLKSDFKIQKIRFLIILLLKKINKHAESLCILKKVRLLNTQIQVQY